MIIIKAKTKRLHEEGIRLNIIIAIYNLLIYVIFYICIYNIIY